MTHLHAYKRKYFFDLFPEMIYYIVSDTKNILEHVVCFGEKLKRKKTKLQFNINNLNNSQTIRLNGLRHLIYMHESA